MNISLSSKTKIYYVLVILILLVMLPNVYLMLGLGILQAILWFSSSLKISDLFRPFKKLSIFFVIILVSYGLFDFADEQQNVGTIDLGITSLTYYPDGLITALMMCFRVFIMVWASIWLQKTEKPGQMAKSLTEMGLPFMLAGGIDSTLALLAASPDKKGKGGGSGKGEGKGKGKKNKIAITFQQIKQGDISFIKDRFDKALKNAKDHIAERYPTLASDKIHDLTIIIGVAVTIMGLKVFQLLPGLPVAPGHKNILIIPLFLLAAGMSKSRFGGTIAGCTVGVVSVLMGFGKFGLFEIAHFAVPGLLADLLYPLISKNGPGWIRFVLLALIGAIMGAGRFAANFLVILLAGAPDGAFLLYLPMLFTQIAFGALSVFISFVMLKIAVNESNNNKPD